MKPLLVAIGALVLVACASLGYQSSTLSLQRDEAMQAIGMAHQACLDGKLPLKACAIVDALVANAAAQKPVDVGSLLSLVTQLLPLAATLAPLVP